MRSIIDHSTPQIITDPIWNLLNIHLYEHFQEYFFCLKVILNPNYNNKFYASCLVTSISGFQILKTISQDFPNGSFCFILQLFPFIWKILEWLTKPWSYFVLTFLDQPQFGANGCHLTTRG